MEKRLMTAVAALAVSTSMAFAQSQISGHVTSSEDGSPVIGASIKVAGTNTGTVTDIDGNFSLNAPAGAKLEITYIGMQSKTVKASSASANHKDLLKSWNGVPEGMTETSPNRIDPNGTPIIDFNLSTYNNDTSDRWLTSADYLIFKNINLSYNLPKAWIQSLGIQGLTVKAGAENLFTLTARKGMNPQYSFSGGADDTYVSARVFNFGLSVTF